MGRASFITRLLAWALVCACLARLGRGCAPPGAANEVALGDDTYVCLVFSPLDWTAGNQSFIRAMIKPTADKFSRFTISDAWDSMDVDVDSVMNSLGSTEIGVHVESMGKFSYQKGWRVSRNGERVTYPFFTAVIVVEKGKVKNVKWDDGCFFCGGSDCDRNTYNYDGTLRKEGKDCYFKDSECVDSNGKVSDLCKMNVYITWSGTDKDGNYFTSSSFRFSQFRAMQTEGYADSLS